MILDEIQHNSIYLCTIIKKGHADLPFNPYLGCIFNPEQSVEGNGIQEGSLYMMPYVLGVPSWGAFGLANLT